MKGKYLRNVEHRRLQASMKTGKLNPMYGTISPNNQGYKTKLRQLIRDTLEYKEWRAKVFARDNFQCQICKCVGGSLSAHHIKSFAEIIHNNKIKSVIAAKLCPELFEINNGITLCEKCHKETDNFLKEGNKYRWRLE